MPPGSTERRSRAPAPVSTLSCASGAAEATRGSFVISGLCGLGLFGDHVQGQLAAAVDLGQFDLDLLAHREYVLDAVDALAADQLRSEERRVGRESRLQRWRQS